MSEPSLISISSIWRALSIRNSWEMVKDEQAFLNRVLDQCRILRCIANETACIQRALRQIYSALLHQGIYARRERAAQELWLACMRVSLQKGIAPSEAEEIAQETFARVLEHLADLRSPQSFLAWVLTIRRTVQRELTTATAHELANDLQTQASADPAEVDTTVEQAIIDRQLREQIQAVLKNNLERETVIRTVLLGEHPRDVARSLDLPLHQARLAKSRGLQKLRADETLRRRLIDLTEENPDESEKDARTATSGETITGAPATGHDAL